MSDLQGEAGETEPTASTSEKDSHKTSFWSVATTGVTAGLIVWKLWHDDIARLHLLYLAIKIFRIIAQTFGSWALTVEKHYYDYVETLH